MPSKAQRAASRQARLSRRRRRGKAAPQDFQAVPTQPTAVSDPAAAVQSRPVRQASTFRSEVATEATSRPHRHCALGVVGQTQVHPILIDTSAGNCARSAL